MQIWQGFRNRVSGESPQRKTYQAGGSIALTLHRLLSNFGLPLGNDKLRYCKSGTILPNTQAF